MRKILSFLIVLVVFVVCAFAVVSAEDINLSVEYVQNEENGTLEITVTDSENTPVLLKIIDEKDMVIFVKALYTDENNKSFFIRLDMKDFPEGKYRVVATTSVSKTEVYTETNGNGFHKYLRFVKYGIECAKKGYEIILSK